MEIKTTATEENYLKAIFKLAERENKAASTNALANHLSTSSASATDMMQKLADKKLVNYKKYNGVTLTQAGLKVATSLIRKHRLWEVFLVNKLRFAWHQVHEIAEELEHIKSSELVSRLDAFLDYPKFDPHGDPIPNADGKFTIRNQKPLSDAFINDQCIVVGVKENDTSFLEYLNSIKVGLGTTIHIRDQVNFDRSMMITIDGKVQMTISEKVAQNILVKNK